MLVGRNFNSGRKIEKCGFEFGTKRRRKKYNTEEKKEERGLKILFPYPTCAYSKNVRLLLDHDQ